MEIKIFAKRIKTPKSLDGRKSFTFSKAVGITVVENHDDGFSVTITSTEPPLITYEKKLHCYGCKHAEDSDLADHCIRKGVEYTFPCVQKNCVWFGKGVFD